VAMSGEVFCVGTCLSGAESVGWVKRTKEEIVKTITDEQYEAGMLQARKRAQWELGDAGWAGVILSAFFNPEDDDFALKEDKGEI